MKRKKKEEERKKKTDEKGKVRINSSDCLSYAQNELLPVSTVLSLAFSSGSLKIEAAAKAVTQVMP